MIYILYPRVNCLKTIPFTAAHTYIVHIWQYPPPPGVQLDLLHANDGDMLFVLLMMFVINVKDVVIVTELVWPFHL